MGFIDNILARKGNEKILCDEIDAREQAFSAQIADLVNQYETGIINHERYIFLIAQAKANHDKALDELERRARGY